MEIRLAEIHLLRAYVRLQILNLRRIVSLLGELVERRQRLLIVIVVIRQAEFDVLVPFCALSEVELDIDGSFEDVLAFPVCYVEIGLVLEEEQQLLDHSLLVLVIDLQDLMGDRVLRVLQLQIGVGSAAQQHL